MAEREAIPEKLKPFVYLGFSKTEASVKEWRGDCIFCGKPGKFYVNVDTGQWSCKAGACQRQGNVYSFLEEWYNYTLELFADEYEERLAELATDRNIPAEAFEDSGLVWDGIQWAIPIRNTDGKLISFRLYRYGRKVQGLPGMDLGLYGSELLADSDGQPVYICEGEFDCIALRYLLMKEDVPGIVMGTPGAGIFKTVWAESLSGRDTVVCYDHDIAGRKGVKRVHSAVPEAKSFFWLKWPDELPDGFDVRDFCGTEEASYEVLSEMLSEFTDDDAESDKTVKGGAARQSETDGYALVSKWFPLRESERPSFEETLETYRKWLEVTPEMENALRVIFAVIYSNQIDGDALWLHLAGPPGTAKTELLMSASQVSTVYTVSTITPHTLISGFQGPGGSDPSLIPRLNGKICLFKDWTEVLRMPKVSKDEIYSILRGAFDGEASKPFGNGMTRKYKSHFSILTGVTQSIFAEQGASLGERFLIFHLCKGVGFDASFAIRMALQNGGNETQMRKELQEAAKTFLEYRVDREDVPELPARYVERMIGLSQLVAMLRATVEKDFKGEKLLYRPQHESGTRLAKQLKKLLLGLALTTEKQKVDDSCYRVLVRVALDTCVGFNLEVLYELAKLDGQTGQELELTCKLPLSTLRDQLEDLVQLGVLRKEKEANPNGRGGPMVRYWRTETIISHWNRANMEGRKERIIIRKAPKIRIKRGLKRNFSGKVT